ncbi:MAG: RHS repeat protein [Rubrivivax sp.]|nr:RHS repeat protein [Rubrivivax sp.]
MRRFGERHGDNEPPGSRGPSFRSTSRCWNADLRARVTCAAILALCAAYAIAAGTERYDYDAVGRLIRHIDPSGQVTEYVYDPVGNILEVRRAGALAPPSIATVAPSIVRRRETVVIVVTGSRFLGGRVLAPEPALEISSVRFDATRLQFTLAARDEAPLGSRTFSVITAGGTAPFAITVQPGLPAIRLTPPILAMAPATSQEVVLRLSNEDILPHTLAIVSSDAGVAATSGAAFLLAPGQTEVRFVVTAGAVGTATLNVSSATLASVPLGVHVVGPIPGENLRYSAAIGVARPAPAAAVSVGPLLTPAVGVTRPTP